MRYFISYLKKVILLRTSLLVMRYPPDTDYKTLYIYIYIYIYIYTHTKTLIFLSGCLINLAILKLSFRSRFNIYIMLNIIKYNILFIIVIYKIVFYKL